MIRPPRSCPADQLGSVSGRYQTALACVPGESWLNRAGRIPHRFDRGPIFDLAAGADGHRQRGAQPDDSQPTVVWSGDGGRTDKMARVEAVLFLAKEPLHARQISKFANLTDGTEALTLISQLNHLYDSLAQAFRVEEVAGGWQLRTRDCFGSWLRRLEHVPPEVRLSAPSMETLAVVAYRQPVVRADVEAIRGVSCGEILRQLMERDLVYVSGRSDELGRPYFYSTTQTFLRVFGLRDLEELPRAAEFRASPQAPQAPQATESQIRAEDDDWDDDEDGEWDDDEDDDDDWDDDEDVDDEELSEEEVDDDEGFEDDDWEEVDDEDSDEEGWDDEDDDWDDDEEDDDGDDDVIDDDEEDDDWGDDDEEDDDWD